MKRTKILSLITAIVILGIICLAVCNKKAPEGQSDETSGETSRETDAVESEPPEETEPESFDDIGPGPYYVPLRMEWSQEGSSEYGDEDGYFYEHVSEESYEYVWEENCVSEFAGGELLCKWEFDRRGVITTETRLLSGEISAVIEYDANANVSKIIYYESGAVTGVRMYEYDGAGNLTKETEYDSSANINYRTLYEYDANVNKVKESQFDSKGNISFESTYEYDENGNVTKVEEYDGNAVLLATAYEYDSRGNLIREISYDIDQAVSSQFVYEYDEHGNKIKMTGYNWNDEVTWIATYETVLPDENTVILKETNYDMDGHMAFYRETREEYRADGKLLKRTVFDENGTVTNSHENKYDENGNMIKKVYYNEIGAGGLETSYYYGWAEATPAQYRFYIMGLRNDWHTLGDVFSEE